MRTKVRLTDAHSLDKGEDPAAESYIPEVGRSKLGTVLDHITNVARRWWDLGFSEAE